MRLGGPIFTRTTDPAAWADAVRGDGYRAAYCPVNADADAATIRAYAAAAVEADIVIAEVGAWSNPLSSDPDTRTAALAKCQAGLILADRIGARCCVNISGSRGPIWDGPHENNLTPETFDRVVHSVQPLSTPSSRTAPFTRWKRCRGCTRTRSKATATCLWLSTVPGSPCIWDPVNLICSPRRYFGNADLIRDCFQTLGPQIKGCHAKDITLGSTLTTHLDEVRPGLGGLDYDVLLGEMARLEPDTPLMLEHLPTEDEYRFAAALCATPPPAWESRFSL